jgi:hypothetical protein
MYSQSKYGIGRTEEGEVAQKEGRKEGRKGKESHQAADIGVDWYFDCI